MANEQLIDTVILPQAGEQVENLSKLLAELDIQFAANIKTVNQFNGAILNTKNFAELNKTVTQTALNYEKIQQAQNKTAQTTLALDTAQKKAAADQQMREDKAMAQLVKKQQAQTAADAKEIAAAEAKAAKLQAIADKQARQSGAFPSSQSIPNAVTEDTGTVRSPSINQPLIASDNLSTGNKQAVAATDEETAALIRQNEALAQLSPEYIANIELLNSLKVEQLENAAALKAVNTNTEQGIELQTLLVANQLRLKVEVAEVTAALSRQTKEQISAEGSVKELTAALELLRNEYFELSAAERDTTAGQALLLNIQGIDKEVKALRVSAGDTSKEVGAYEKAIAKATSGTQLAAQAVTIATRSIVRMIVQFALFTVVLDAAEWLYKYIAALNIFNPIATEAEMRQKALVDAFGSGEFQKGIENIEKLGANLDLASKGIEDSSVAINEYNETIGKTYGYVNNLNDAQKGFIDNKDAYIKAIIDESAAQLLAADAAKQVAELYAKNQQEQQKIIDAQNSQQTLKQLNAGGGRSGAGVSLARLQLKDDIRDANDAIAENKKRIDEIIDRATKGITSISGDKQKATGGQQVGSNPEAELKNKIANEALERQKIIDQKIIADEKESYSRRLAALADFYEVSKQIQDNNEALTLSELPKNDARREDIEKKAANDLLSLQEQTGNQRRQLLDKQYKQDQEIIKNNIEKQRDLFKSILDDPNQSYDAKLIALDVYNRKSKDLIDANYDEQVKAAGENGEALKLAGQVYDKAIIELANDTASQHLKIVKENLAKILEASKESEQEQIETAQSGANLALEALTNVKDKKIKVLDEGRKTGKIKEKEYNQELLDINDQYAIDRLRQEIALQSAILAIKETDRDNAIASMQKGGASKADIDKYTSGANKDIQGTKNTISGLGNQLDNAISKKEVDDTKTDAEKKKETQEKVRSISEDANKAEIAAIDGIDKLRQRAFENEIARLEKLSQQIDDNANAEKQQVNDSIASNATKAREIKLIDAQTASAKKAIQAQENKEKEKAAKADKEATIAKIISTGALAVITALTAGPVIGVVLAAITAATVAVELATAIATPLPSYAKGTDNHPGGLALWGEAGQEMATLPDGTRRLSNGATIENLPRGTKITPHMELMQQLRPTKVDYVGGEAIGWKEVLGQLKKMEPKNNRPRVVVNVDISGEMARMAYLKR